MASSKIDLLATAERVITNSLNEPRILALVEPHGYSAAGLAIGTQLSDAAKQAVDAQLLAAGKARQATQQAHMVHAEARAHYRTLLRTIHAIYPSGAPERSMLELPSATPRKTDAFIETALTLYNNVLSEPAILADVAQHGYDQHRLEAERMSVVLYRTTVQAQARAKADAMCATESQTKALAALNSWLTRYLSFARVALEREPQLLKAFGIKKPPTRQAASSPATSPAELSTPIPTLGLPETNSVRRNGVAEPTLA